MYLFEDFFVVSKLCMVLFVTEETWCVYKRWLHKLVVRTRKRFDTWNYDVVKHTALVKETVNNTDFSYVY